MSMTLSSFGSATKTAVIGASGGIGRALCDLLLQTDSVHSLHAFSRTEQSFDDERVIASSLDITHEHLIETAASRVDDLDLVIVATGLLHSGTMQPEKTSQQLTAAHLAQVYSVNTIAPLLIAKHFLPRLARKRKSVFAVLSARVGSIADNRLGGWYAYRMSKAALNMAIKTLSIEHARRAPQSVVVALHPGTVNTDLSKPFSARTPAQQLFSPPQSAAYLLDVMNSLQPADTGGFFAWDARRIPW